MVNRDVYTYTKDTFAYYLKDQKKKLREKHGVNLSTADVSSLLMKNVIEPNNINLCDTIKPIDINKKWGKLKLKL